MDWAGTLVFLLIFGGMAYAMLKPRKGPVRVCTVCHHQGQAKQRTSGSMGIELVLYLFFIVPGLIYSLWRLSTRKWVCASCGAEALVPPDSPAGKLLTAPPTAK